MSCTERSFRFRAAAGRCVWLFLMSCPVFWCHIFAGSPYFKFYSSERISTILWRDWPGLHPSPPPRQKPGLRLCSLGYFTKLSKTNEDTVSSNSYSWLTNRTPTSGSSNFVNHSYDYRPNWTPLSPITIVNLHQKRWCYIDITRLMAISWTFGWKKYCRAWLCLGIDI